MPSEVINECTAGEVTEGEILDMIAKMKNSNSYGNDELDTATLKIGGKFLARPIKFVINLSLGTGEFPSKWKMARVIPLLKSGDLDKLSPK